MTLTPQPSTTGLAADNVRLSVVSNLWITQRVVSRIGTNSSIRDTLPELMKLSVAPAGYQRHRALNMLTTNGSRRVSLIPRMRSTSA